MKRLFIAFIFVFLLASCKSEEVPTITYDASDFVFEINQEDIDLSEYFQSENTLLIDDHNLEYDTLGEYTLFVTDTVTGEKLEIEVHIVDTIAPEIHIPEDFEQHYERGSELDLSTITVLDNSLEEVSYTTNLHEINMNQVGTYSLIIISQDSTGNLSTTAIDIFVRSENVPMIEIQTSNISSTSFSVEFFEDDVDGYKIESSYKVCIGDTIVYQGNLTDTYTFNLTNLLQNTDYTVDMTFVYQIPGEEQEIMTSRVLVTTLELFEPIIELKDLLITQDSITFEVAVIDPDNLLDGVDVYVYDDEQTELMYVLVEDSKNIMVTELQFGHEYTIVFEYPYDFADGNGLQEHSDTYTYDTTSKTEPTVISEVDVTGNSLEITTYVLDTDMAIVSLTVLVYEDTTLLNVFDIKQSVAEYGDDTVVVLNYDTDYRVIVEVIYETIEGEQTLGTVLDIVVHTETQN